jgi:purine-nucleoside phosphorylase
MAKDENEGELESIDDIEQKFRKIIKYGLVSEAKDFAERREIKKSTQNAIAYDVFHDTVTRMSANKSILKHEVSIPIDIAHTFGFRAELKSHAGAAIHDYCKAKKDTSTLKRIKQEFPEYF